MIFEILQPFLKPVLDLIIGIKPEYGLFILMGISLGISYAYSKIDFKSFFSPMRATGFVIVFSAVIFLLLEAIVK